jgi:hypothetical protein
MLMGSQKGKMFTFVSLSYESTSVWLLIELEKRILSSNHWETSEVVSFLKDRAKMDRLMQP